MRRPRCSSRTRSSCLRATERANTPTIVGFPAATRGPTRMAEPGGCRTVTPMLRWIPPLAAAGAALAFAPAADAAAMPCLLTEATRITSTTLNLDRDKAKERIDIYNFDAAGAPVTQFQVCDRSQAGELVRAQLVTVNESPGDRESGLRASWVGDLDRAGRIEIAVRDYLTPSAGEVLSIYRQKAKNALTFVRVQRIPGDQAVLSRPRGSSAVVTVLLKANHASDGRAHKERWTYRAASRKWACATDCGGR